MSPMQDNEATMDQRLDQLRRDQVENMEQTSASMSTKMARMSGEIMEMQGLQARLQKEIEANLRVELQRFVVEELQVRRLNELEALQKEDSRHRADIDALRDQLTSALEAFSITAQKPLPAPVDTHEDLEKLREDLSEECGELAERYGEGIMRVDCPDDSEREPIVNMSGVDLSVIRIMSICRIGGLDTRHQHQLPRVFLVAAATACVIDISCIGLYLAAEGLDAHHQHQLIRVFSWRQHQLPGFLVAGATARVISISCFVFVAPGATARIISISCFKFCLAADQHQQKASTRIISISCLVAGAMACINDISCLGFLAAEGTDDAGSMWRRRPGMQGECLIRELLAGQQRQEAQTAELKNRLGMLSREIEEVQKQQLESLRDASAMKQRLTVQVEQLRQEQQSIVDLAEAERQNAGEWNLFKAFGGGCRAPAESTAREESRIRPPPSNAATIEELDLVRAKQHQEALEMKTQQRSFFDEVLNQQSTSQQQLASQLSNQLEVVQSQCTAAIAGLHSQQTSTLE
ncbi:unnamed protein product, partial [Symbiodinium microadriaticum]